MARKSKDNSTDVRIYPQKNLLPFKREDYIRQPNSVSRMEYKMELLQLRAFACFLEKLEPLVLKLISRYNANINGQNVSGVPAQKLSIFDLEEAKPYITPTGRLEVEIPYMDLGIGWGYYARAKPILENMVNLKIRFFKREKYVDSETIAPVFRVTTCYLKDQKKKIKAFRLSVERDILDLMIDLSIGYRDLLKRIAFVASNIYTARLYVFVSAHMRSDGRNTFEVPIEELRNFLDLYTETKGEKSIKYPRYYDLKKRVLDPAVNELKELAEHGNSDFWIDITPIGRGPNSNPLRFSFKVHYSDLVCDLEMKKEQQKEDMDLNAMLSGKLKQTPSNIRKIQQRLTPEMKLPFRKEVDRLVTVISERKDIENIRAFAWTSLNTWIEDHTVCVEEIVPEESHPVPVHPVPIQQELFSEQNEGPENERWNLFMEELKKISGNDFDKWFYVLEFSSVDEETLSVKVPTRAFASILTEQYSETLYAALSLAYGERKLKFVL